MALLQEVAGGRLPLFKFIELFEKRYHRSISVAELYRMRSVVDIQEMSGSGRTVVLVTSPRSASPKSEKTDSPEKVSHRLLRDWNIHLYIRTSYIPIYASVMEPQRTTTVLSLSDERVAGVARLQASLR